MYNCILTTVVNNVTTTKYVTDELMNWDDVTLSYKREGLGAVMRAFSTEFEFAGEAYSMLLSAFVTDGVRAEATVQFDVRDPIAYTYTTLFYCALDFSTFTHDGYRCSVNAVDNTIASRLKAEKSQKFQTQASSLAGRTLYYRHLPMLNRISWTVNEEIDTDDDKMYGQFAMLSGQAAWTMIPLVYTGAEIAVAGTSEYADVAWAYGKTGGIEGKVRPFFTAGMDMSIDLDFHIKTGVPDASGENITVFDIILAKIETGEDGAKTLSVLETEDALNYRTIDIQDTYTLATGDALALYLLVSGDNGVLPSQTSYEIEESSLSVTYEATDLRVVEIWANSLTGVMQWLLDSIFGASVVSGSINSADDRVTHARLLAAESIRGISGAQIYTSWDDFCKMMDAEFGLVPVIDEDTSSVEFNARPSYVYDYIASPAHRFIAGEASDFQLRVAEDLLAGKVSIGYDKQEYDSVNGRDEWRWTAEYRSGITVTENALEMICPYRADVYGIEFLTLTRSEQTTDKEADEDVFLADCAVNMNNVFTMRTDVPVTGIIAQNAMPNARYTQYEMVIANSFVLGRLTDALDFTSIGGNESAVVGGRAVTADISLVGLPHLLPYEVTFTTPLQTLYNFRKTLAVDHRGLTYTGFVKDVRFGVGRDARVTYTLILNQIT